MRHVRYFALVIACLALGFAERPAQAQTALQMHAQQKYNEYVAAHEATWRIQAQGAPQDVYNQYLNYEQQKWNEFLQAQNAANAEANQVAMQQHILQADNAIASWNNYLQQIYQGTTTPAYQNDPNYRAIYDNWMQGPVGQAREMIAQLQNYRAQYAGAANPPPPPVCTRAPCGPGGTPASTRVGDPPSISWDPNAPPRPR